MTSFISLLMFIPVIIGGSSRVPVPTPETEAYCVNNQFADASWCAKNGFKPQGAWQIPE